jgi:Flp pilus assembly protein TadG
MSGRLAAWRRVRGASRVLRDLACREEGQSIVLFAVALVAVFAFASFAIDIGRVLLTHRQLQAAADAASLAAVVELPDTSAAAGQAAAYGAGPGEKNTISGQTVASSTSFKCVTSIGTTDPPCKTDPSKPNAISVTEKTSVPLLFGGVIGWNSMSVSASSTALAQGGAQPLDVMLVLDTTGSMSAPCGATVPGIASPSKLQCAKAGAQALLAQLRPGIDKVGLVIFPPLKSGVSTAPEFTTNCSASWAIPSGPTDLSYATNSTYVITGLSNSFLLSSGSLDPSSPLAQALNYNGGGANVSKGCGLESPGGVNTYFPDALKFAQTQGLDADSGSHLSAIVFLSDGEGNTAANGDITPCQTAIANAAAIKAQPPAGAGTTIYGVGYWENAADSSTYCGISGNLSPYTGYQEVQAIASPGNFYAYYNGSSTTLTDIFTQIGQQLVSSARLVPDGTP